MSDNGNDFRARNKRLQDIKKRREERKTKRLVKNLIWIAAIVLGISAIFVIHFTSESNRIAKNKEMENYLASLADPTAAPITETLAPATEKPISEASVNQAEVPTPANNTVIVLDPGHGKSSSSMSSDEKRSEGYSYSEANGSWGEWRHYKHGTNEDCQSSECTQTGPGCWYSMGNGDRDTEPEINLNNAMAAKRYLEDMGYTVRMTRTSNSQNPSMNKRVSYCFPNNDTSLAPDACLYVCVHSNAGGGRGTSYIALEDTYTQKYIGESFTSASNTAGKIINNNVAQNTGLANNGSIGGMGYLILFNKVPVPIAYLEIGFYDNSSDLAILQSESDSIGRGIAEGINEYLSAS